MTIYGVRYCTDSRQPEMEWRRFATMAAATRWRDTVGPGGDGPSLAPDNGHRYLHRLYQVTGRFAAKSALVKIITARRCSYATAQASWIMDHGKAIE